MSLVRHDDNIVVGINRRLIRLIEFLNQGKDEAGISSEFCRQIRAAGGDELGCFGCTQQSAVFEGVTDLLVQLVSIRQNHDGRRTGELSADLLGQEHHGIAFSAALCMPEHAQLAVSQFSGFIGFHGLVYTQVLVVSGKNFHGMPI